MFRQHQISVITILVLIETGRLLTGCLENRTVCAEDTLVYEFRHTKAEREAHSQIQSALNQRVDFQFSGESLADVVSFLGRNEIPARIDSPALETLGLGDDTFVDFHQKEVSIRSGLRLLLNPLELTWSVRNEVLLITTYEESQKDLSIRMFDLSNLLPNKIFVSTDGDHESGFDIDLFKETIEVSIAPDSWDAVGGPGSAIGIELRGMPLLIISQTDEIQEKVEQLIRSMHRATGAPLPMTRLPADIVSRVPNGPWNRRVSSKLSSKSIGVDRTTGSTRVTASDDVPENDHWTIPTPAWYKGVSFE